MCSLGGQEPDAGDEVLSPRLRSESISASTLSSHPGPHMQLSSAGSPAEHPAWQRMAGHHVARSPAPGDTTYTNAARRRIRPVSAGDSPELTDSPPGSGQAHLFTLGAVNLVRSVGREVRSTVCQGPRGMPSRPELLGSRGTLRGPGLRLRTCPWGRAA